MITGAVLENGRLHFAKASVVDESGADECVAVRVEANTPDGWLVLTREKALEVAARLMVYAGATE